MVFTVRWGDSPRDPPAPLHLCPLSGMTLCGYVRLTPAVTQKPLFYQPASALFGMKSGNKHWMKKKTFHGGLQSLMGVGAFSEQKIRIDTAPCSAIRYDTIQHLGVFSAYRDQNRHNTIPLRSQGKLQFGCVVNGQWINIAEAV